MNEPGKQNMHLGVLESQATHQQFRKHMTPAGEMTQLQKWEGYFQRAVFSPIILPLSLVRDFSSVGLRPSTSQMLPGLLAIIGWNLTNHFWFLSWVFHTQAGNIQAAAWTLIAHGGRLIHQNQREGNHEWWHHFQGWGGGTEVAACHSMNHQWFLYGFAQNFWWFLERCDNFHQNDGTSSAWWPLCWLIQTGAFSVCATVSEHTELCVKMIFVFLYQALRGMQWLSG